MAYDLYFGYPLLSLIFQFENWYSGIRKFLCKLRPFNFVTEISVVVT